MPVFSARSLALDGVSWVQGGEVGLSSKNSVRRCTCLTNQKWVRGEATKPTGCQLVLQAVLPKPKFLEEPQRPRQS
jgi:hypothetical protein